MGCTASKDDAEPTIVSSVSESQQDDTASAMQSKQGDLVVASNMFNASCQAKPGQKTPSDQFLGEGQNFPSVQTDAPPEKFSSKQSKRAPKLTPKATPKAAPKVAPRAARKMPLDSKVFSLPPRDPSMQPKVASETLATEDSSDFDNFDLSSNSSNDDIKYGDNVPQADQHAKSNAIEPKSQTPKMAQPAPPAPKAKSPTLQNYDNAALDYPVIDDDYEVLSKDSLEDLPVAPPDPAPPVQPKQVAPAKAKPKQSAPRQPAARPVTPVKEKTSKPQTANRPKSISKSNARPSSAPVKGKASTSQLPIQPKSASKSNRPNSAPVKVSPASKNKKELSQKIEKHKKLITKVEKSLGEPKEKSKSSSKDGEKSKL